MLKSKLNQEIKLIKVLEKVEIDRPSVLKEKASVLLEPVEK